MQLSNASPYPIQYDLSNCEHEPLPFIATVQSHACLVACKVQDWTITQVSSNAGELLGIAATDLLQQPLGNKFPETTFASILSAVAKGNEYLAANPVRINMPNGQAQNWLNCLIHPQGEVYVLEFEPFDEDTINYRMQRTISEAMYRIQYSETLQEVFQTAAEELKSIIGYDRVMIYQFDEAGHGTVMAEAKEPALEAFLGLRYPASDIPPQARALFLKNPARIISDVLAEPAQILPPISPLTGQPLDLTDFVGRGVSPIHLEYLRNMGVRASMSIAIVFEEKLWGLISCHHYSPKSTGHFKRTTAWFLGKLISGHLSLRSANEHRKSVMKANVVKSKLFEQMSVNWDLVEGLTTGPVTMLDLHDSGGAAIFHEGKLNVLGEAPPKPALQELIKWLDGNLQETVYSTNELPKHFAPARDWKDKACGLLAVRLSNDAPSDYLLWFRPEVIQTVNWGGNPSKAVTKTADNVRISPRKSFSKWTELVQNTAKPWLDYELETVVSLRNDVKDFIFQKYRQVQQTNKELTEAYEDMEAFSYSISHDLRAPLRTIEGYSDLLLEDYGEVLGENGNHFISTIKDSAAKLNELIIGLLAYTRAKRQQLILNSVSLDEVVRLESNLLMQDALRQSRNIELRIGENLPTVLADKPALTILVKNLLSNAFKYTTNSNPSIIEIGGDQSEGYVSFYVRDNGIGFDMQYTDRIFGVFNRLVNDDQFEGTGIGLAIVKRIIEKHGGAISVESVPNQGTTFFVRMPNIDH